MKKTKLSLILLSLAVIATITISSCKKDDTDDNTTTTTTTPTTNENDLSIPKFTATIDGTNISYIEGTNDFEGICGTDKNIGDSATIKYNYEIWNSASTSSAGITKGTLVSHSGSVASTTLFNNFITTGTCNFSDNAANGIEITWRNNSTDVWTTTGTSQTGSSFSFAIVNNTDVMGSHYARFKATFNCKLICGSTVKTLTNGVFIGEFENQ